MKPKPKPKRAPKPNPVPRQSSSVDETLYDDPEALNTQSKLAPTRPGCYDDVTEILPGYQADNVYDDVECHDTPTTRYTTYLLNVLL